MNMLYFSDGPLIGLTDMQELLKKKEFWLILERKMTLVTWGEKKGRYIKIKMYQIT